MLETVMVKRLTDEVVAQIQGLLLEDVLGDDRRLPSEREMAEQLGVSRAVVREALSVLESTGFVERRKGRGTFARKLDRMDILKGMVVSSAPTDYGLFADFLEVRKVLETQAIEWAIQRATRQDLARIKTTLEMLANATRESIVEADILFHLYIAAAAHNEVLFELTRNIGQMLREVRRRTLLLPGRQEACFQEHRDILVALQTGDCEGATEMMKKHIGKVEDLIGLLYDGQ